MLKKVYQHRYTIAILLLLLSLFSGSSLLIFNFFPEKMLLGKWKETGWSYENINKENFVYHDIQLGRKHEAESWRFTEGHKLYFYNGNDVAAQATWKIKGRGHILQLTYEDGYVEVYDIKELNNDKLILNFDIGMESRGIARLVFTKIANK